VLQSIVVGTDGSATAGEAVRQAAELAGTTGAKLHVVSAAVPVHVMAGAAMNADVLAFAPDPIEIANGVLDEVKARLEGSGLEVAVHARQLSPAEAIIEVAEEQNADLIVVGDRGMQAKRRFLLGSVPDRVSHHAPCSVLIIKTR
jgi:nucleotide-binding universal stress UspA family protein